MAVRAVKTLPTFPPPTVANVTLNPTSVRALAPCPLAPPPRIKIQSRPSLAHTVRLPHESEFTEATATVTRLGQERD